MLISIFQKDNNYVRNKTIFVNLTNISSGELGSAWMDEYSIVAVRVNIVEHRAIEWSGNMENVRLRVLSSKNMKLYAFINTLPM